MHSQGERDIWYFGQQAGMVFNGTNTQSLSDNSIERNIVFGFIEGTENLICANNEEGELLFYSDGRKFRNRLHQSMLNTPTNEYSVYFADGAIARDPGNDNRYYVFANIQDGTANYLTYTVVNMALDDGLGGLEPDNTHVLMTTDVGQHMTVARHANGRDSWLITVRRGSYYAYLITENGIATSPVVTSAGVSIFDGPFIDFGTIEISPNNELLAATFPGLNKTFLLDFNDLTGRMSLIWEYEDLTDPFVDRPNSTVEFSANSKVLYQAEDATGIRQFDISDLDNIPEPIVIATEGRFPYLKRGPNDKIYSIQSGDFFIGAIHEPDVIGLGCDYERFVQGLSGSGLLDLPVFLQPKFPEGISYINICEGEVSQFYFEGSFREDVRIEWDLGDGNTGSGENVNHLYVQPGTYSVVANVFNEENDDLLFTDTKEIIIYDSPEISELDDLYFCTEDNLVILSNFNLDVLNGQSPEDFSVRYYFSLEDAQLSSNEEQELIPEIGTKTIWVRIENKFSPTCHVIGSFNLIAPEFIEIDMPTEQYLCDLRTGLTITALDGFLSYSWSNGEDSQSITVFSTGRYTLTVQKDFGDFVCEAQTTIVVLDGDELPQIEEINVIDWSQNHNSIEIIVDRIGLYEYSVDGINYQESPIFNNLLIDDYYVYVRDIRCQKEIRSDKLYLLFHDKFFTPNGDGNNDYWRVINNFREEDIEIQIFDRYGKLLETMSYFDRGWDGTSNGIEMPTADYWFRVVRQSGKVHYGHFTLKR